MMENAATSTTISFFTDFDDKGLIIEVSNYQHWIMSKTQCSTCFEPKATLQCKACSTPQCKKCVNVVGDERLTYLDDDVPKLLEGGGVFCNSCFGTQIAPTLNEYDEIMERAKQVFVFSENESKETRLIRRSERKFQVTGEDEKDIVLKLAFLAAKAGFNCVVDITVKGEKRRDGSYKLMTWTGSGTAAQVDAARHNR